MRNILVIEDDHNIRVVIRQALESEGYKVYSAANGRDGLELLKQIDQPNLILLDLMMPLMTGWEFIKAQKKHRLLRDIPVVIVSATESIQGTHVPAREIIHKPFEIQELLNVVKKHCDDKTSEETLSAQA